MLMQYGLGGNMAEMKYLPAGRKSRRVSRWILLGVVMFVFYVLLGNSTSTEKLQQFVIDRSQVEVVRYSDLSVGSYSRVVLIRDTQDNRTAITFVKVPFLDRWNLSGQQTADNKTSKPIAIEIDDGFGVLKAEVSYDRVNILESTSWSGTYAKTISIGLFILLAVGINYWLGRYKRNKVV